MLPKIPRNNLAPLSQPWARWVDDAAIELDTRVDKITSSDINVKRSTHAIIDNLDFQVQDLASRQPVSGTIATLTTSTTGTFTRSVTFGGNPSFLGPLTGGGASIVGYFTVTSGSGLGVDVMASVYLNGTAIIENKYILYTLASTPPSWASAQSTSFSVHAPLNLNVANTLSITYTITSIDGSKTVNGNIGVVPQ